MSEKRYFIFWLILGSLLQLTLTVMLVLENNMEDVGSLASSELIDQQPVWLLINGLMGVALSLLFTAIVLAIGMDFAKKIGAKLLLLQKNYDLKKDILYPAIATGIAVSCVAIVANLISSFELFSFAIDSSYFFSYKMLITLFATIQYDTRLLLFWISGLALLIKTVTRNISMNVMMYVSIVLIACLFNIGSPIWYFGTSFIASNPTLVFGSVMRCGIDIVLGILFWKKGFEAAVLCHVIIVLTFYTITPMLVLH